MKKKTTLAAVLIGGLAILGNPSMALAQSSTPNTSKEVYDFSGFSDEALLELFATAIAQGRNYPTLDEFAAKGMQASDIAFIRSHVKKRQILSRANRLIQDTYENRNLWMNIPTASGSGGSAGYPSSNFSSDVFSMWQYTNLFGAWNHSFFTVPGAWTDAAHKNGTDMMSGIKFFDTTNGSSNAPAQRYVALITATDANGYEGLKYVKPLVHLLKYFGQDGINYNFESSSWSNSQLMAFHRACYKYAKEIGFDNFHIGMYTSSSNLSAYNAPYIFGSNNTKTADLMLNYSGGDFSYNMAQSVNYAKTAMNTTDGLYAGVWIVTMDRGWSRLNNGSAKECGLCLWGEHKDSRFWSYNTGADAYIAQSNYQMLLERAFSGGHRNPVNRPGVSDSGNNWEWNGSTPPLLSFAGLATWIPERTAISHDLPFLTNFNLGNGDRYTYKGKKTASSWYNMANQDVVPTYRWLVYQSGTESAGYTYTNNIQPEFTSKDSYTGGTSLLLSGTPSTTGTDILLYKTNLNVSSTNPYVNIAVKTGKEGTNETLLSVILKKQNGSWIEIPVGSIEGKTWIEKKLNVNDLSQSDVITAIGLRVKGSMADYKLNVGKLEINDNSKINPSSLKNVVVDVREETKTTLSAKINWEVEGNVDAYGMLTNDDANISHFEVLYKNSADGKVSEVGRTTQWATYVGNIELADNDKPFIGVRAVSKDLKTYSPVIWTEIPRAEQSTLPDYEVDTYGISQVDPSSNGVDVARRIRYVTSVTTTGADQNLAYTASGPQTDGTQYVNATNNVLKVQQGQVVTIKIQPYDTSNGLSHDGIRYCIGGAWMDLDGSGTFGPDDINTNPQEGEKLFQVGTVRQGTPSFETQGITQTFTVPTDAKRGKSRLRIVFTDAWFAGTFLPTGLTSKGFSIDFGVEITGTNADRQTAGDTHDQGIAEEPEQLNTSTNIVNLNADASTLQVQDGGVSLSNVDKVWVYSIDGKLVNYVTEAKAISLAQGIYLVKMQKGNIIRTEKVVIK